MWALLVGLAPTGNDLDLHGGGSVLVRTGAPAALRALGAGDGAR